MLIALDSKPSAEEIDEDLFDLSSAYDGLCGRIWRAGGYRQFALIGEIMEVMLRTKVIITPFLLYPP
jgi:hypothetical protein